MAKFTVTGCTSADVSLAKNNFPAFWTDTTWRLVWTLVNKTLDQVVYSGGIRMPHMLQIDRARRRHTKAVDENGNIAGYCRWVLPVGADEELWSWAKVPKLPEEEGREAERVYEAADWKHDETMDEHEMEAIRDRILAQKNYMVLDYLAVHPDRKGQGLGTLLVEAGLKEVENMQFDVFVIAKPGGVGIYKRAGFKVLDYVELDYTKYGGPGLYGFTYLEYTVKEPKNLKPVAKKVEEKKTEDKVEEIKEVDDLKVGDLSVEDKKEEDSK